MPPEMPPPPPSGPPEGMPPGGPEGAPDESGGEEVIQAIKTLMVFAKSQQNPALEQAVKALMDALQGGGAPPEAEQPAEMGQMPMNAGKDSAPVM